MNTVEGGLSSFHLEGGADLIFQIGTAKYGVRDEDGHLSDEKLKKVARHDQVKMFEIKEVKDKKDLKQFIKYPFLIKACNFYLLKQVIHLYNR